MPYAERWDADRYAALYARFVETGSWETAAVEFGISVNAARNRALRWRQRQPDRAAAIEAGAVVVTRPAPQPTGASVEIETAGDITRLRIAGTPRVTSLDEALERHGYTPHEWTIIKATVKHYEQTMKGPDGEPVVTPMSSIAVEMKPNREAKAAAKALELLADRIAKHTPKPVRRVATWRADDDLLFEVNLSDAHIAMLAWGPETGAPYDTEIAVESWRYAVGQLVDIASHWRVSQIILPTGNDLLHADTAVQGKGGQTTAGTQQDVDTRWPKMLETGTRLLVETIDGLGSIAPVHVRMVHGNHAQRSEFMLGQVLSAWYRQDDRIDIANPVSPRSAYQHGSTMIGYTHGHGVKPQHLPLIFADEYPDMWAATRWRQIHIGHWHAAKRMDYEEFRGVRVVVVPGMTGTDSWHAISGYRHQRCAEGRLWSRERGPIATFNVWLEADAKSGIRL